MTHCNTIELTPNPAFLVQAMRHIGYTLDTALADIIDNSIAADASRISVQYRWNNGEPWIAILDDGNGMSQGKLMEAMRFGGQSSPDGLRSANDLGRFGLGLKTASLSQCRLLTVISKQSTNISACAWDVDFLANAKSEKWNALIPDQDILNGDHIVSSLLAGLNKFDSGTVVIWQNIDAFNANEKRKVPETSLAETMERVSKHIGLVYHRLLVSASGRKSTKIDFNGTCVEPFNPFGLAVASRRELAGETILIQNHKIEIQPYVLPHCSKISKQDYQTSGGEEGYLHNQGFYVYRNRRLIVKGTWFRLVPKTELTKLLRVRIDIPNSLDHLWQLDVKKSQAHPPQMVLDRLKEVILRIVHEGRRVYVRRGSRTIDNTVHVWRREISEGKISYVINEDHPFVRNLVDDGNNGVDQQKLACLRVISGAFPTEVFHVDANDDKVEIVSVAPKEEREQAVFNLIRALRDSGLNKVAIGEQLKKNELLVTGERLAELIAEVFHG